jgi:GTP-binding protein
VNKWDLAGEVVTEKYMKYISAKLPGLYFAPVAYVSILEDTNVWAPLEIMFSLLQQAQATIPTPRLNDLIHAAVKKRSIPPNKGKVPKIYYSVQVGTRPPAIRIFTNASSLIKKSYRRYLANQIRENSEFKELPIKIGFVSKKDNKKIDIEGL